MPKDYYLILGITSDATLDDIKDAYRRRAKEFHPDHYGDNHSPFLAVQEAYSILSDPIKRQTHDLELSQKKKRRPQYGECMKSRPKTQVEPLIPEQEQPMDLGTGGLSRACNTNRPSFDDLFDRLFYDYKHSPKPKNEDFRQLNVVITLTPEQAFQGGQIKVPLPAQQKCPSCSGQGWIDGYGCRRCRRKGMLPEAYPVMISYPSGISDHHVVQIPLGTHGFKNLYLTVHFRISTMF
ncbi:DnaJ domain-containing protein [uncultured Desulfobacter sp.]|uniref:DnaJ domain-containing protein n=1 Tax=uncultured Desulfobacter sp. TaxID=240139 RepID=UPI0029F46667|nr:DnaJ domain-containing protein [uncultured Desulfobacter sp.]